MDSAQASSETIFCLSESLFDISLQWVESRDTYNPIESNAWSKNFHLHHLRKQAGEFAECKSCHWQLIWVEKGWLKHSLHTLNELREVHRTPTHLLIKR